MNYPGKILFAIILLLISSGCYSQDKIKIIAPPAGVYHGAFPDMGPTEDVVTAERINAFNSLVGKNAAWVYFSNNWFNGIKFPKAEVEAVKSTGSVPFIRMMPRSDFIEGKQDPVYTLQKIIEGAFDNQLKQWARDAKSSGTALMVEFGTEANGDWFSWGGAINGAGKKDGYGDNNIPDGPERFKDAYIHIIELCNNEGALNITWAFHMDAYSAPEAAWNKMKYYYPGDEYIDWIGLSVYGGQEPGENWDSFSSQLADSYNEIASLSSDKPIAIFEFGVIEDPVKGNKSKWIEDALKTISSGKYPRIKALSYWHSSWKNDDGSESNMRLDSDTEALDTYKQLIADPVFITQLSYSR